MIRIVVAPVPGSADKFLALDGETGFLLCTSSAPFLDAARVLLARGILATKRIVMVHADKPEVECLRSTVGAAAKLAVRETEGAPRFVKWRAFPESEGGRAPQRVTADAMKRRAG